MTERPAGTLGPLARELALVGFAVLAVVLPFVNGAVAGRPAETASLDLRYALVVSGATLGLLSATAWRARAGAPWTRRVRLAVVAFGLVPVAFALRAPGDPLWTSLVSLELVFAAPAIALSACFRIARTTALPRPAAIALATSVPLVLAFGWGLLVWALASTQLGVAPVRLAHQAPLRQAGESEVEFRAEDGTLLRGTYTAGRRGAGGVIILHGISDGRTRMAAWSSALAERGYHTLRIDWRAHGRSAGSVTTFADREQQDLDAAFTWLAAQPGVDATKMAVLGTSMGAGVALASTQRLAPRGLRGIVAFAPTSDYAALVEPRLAVVGPFAGIARTIMEGVAHGLGQLSPFELSPARALADGPPVPVLVFHGDADETVALAQSQALYDSVSTVELHILPGVGHANVPAAVLDDATARRRVLRFLRTPRVRRAPDEPLDDTASDE